MAIASGLSSLMRPGAAGKALLKWVSLRKLAGSALDEARRSMLMNVIETYLPLSGRDEEQFRQLAAQPEGQEVQHMINVYEERGMVKGMRLMLERLLESKFGPLPQALIERIEAIQSEDELDALAKRVLVAASLEDMGLSATPGD